MVVRIPFQGESVPSFRDLSGRVVRILALAGVYAIVGRLGLSIAPVNLFASLVWPPTGIALAALLLGGTRLWPGVLLGAFAANAWAGAPVLVATGIAVGNTLEAWVGARLLRSAGARPGSLERVRDVLAFVLLGALLSTTLSATVGVSSLHLAGLLPRGNFLETWRVWWLGDAVGALVVGGLLLAWSRPLQRPVVARRLGEGTALGAVVTGAAMLVFLHQPVEAAIGFVQACLLIPLLMWTGLRFELRGATAAVLVASGIAVAGTALGRGPFVLASTPDSLLYLQTFMAVVAVAVLVVAAVTAERAEAMRRYALGEQALRRSELELKRITGVTPVMLTRCSRDLRYRFVNPAYARMLGRTPEEIAGRPIVEIMGATGFEAIRPRVESVLKGHTVEYEDDVHFAGVGYRSLHVTYVPDEDERGEVAGWIASIVDVSDRKRAEAEARSLAQFPAQNPNPVMRASAGGALLYANGPARELLETMGWRAGRVPRALLEAIDRVPATGALRDVEVLSPPDRVHVFTLSRAAGEGHVNLFGLDITGRKRAEEAMRDADRRKSEFLGVLSHELRNPLAPIRNALHLLRRAPEDPERAAGALAVIERQTRQLARLVDDLLDVTRISQGKIQLRRGRAELTELVRQAVEDHRPVLDARGVALAATIDAGPLWMDADAARVTQIAGNLLQNAAKFTKPGGHVAVTVERAGAGSATLRVTDDGIGIDPAVLPIVFDPFTQADESLDRSLGGLGLGLALVKALVEMHGGRVEARSAGLGRGAEFAVSLPLVADAGAGREAAREPRLAPPGGRRVLVIEDNVDAAEMLRQALSLGGHEVEVANGGEEGVAKVRAFEPDVVICDIGLPGLDGYGVARRILAEHARAPTLIALTGYALPEDRAKAREAGFARHLAKPVEIDALLGVLAQLGTDARGAAER